jgi:hypothetical protein
MAQLQNKRHHMFMKTIFPYTQHEYDIAYTISPESVLSQIDKTYTTNHNKF